MRVADVGAGKNGVEVGDIGACEPALQNVGIAKCGERVQWAGGRQRANALRDEPVFGRAGLAGKGGFDCSPPRGIYGNGVFVVEASRG